jgi:hypothetical protein
MKSSVEVTPDKTITAKPKYYEENGALLANANRAWILSFVASAIAVVAIIFAILVRMQPPTFIGIRQNGEPVLLGKSAKGSNAIPATGTDEFLNEAFVKRFLDEYLNYSAADVDDRWYRSLNMMTRNLRDATLKKMKDDNTRGKIDSEHIESEFHLRDLSRVPGAQHTYLVYGVKDVHHLVNGSETTDHFVSEYRVRLIPDDRSDVNPDGLWIAEYSERPIDAGRTDQTSTTQSGDGASGGGGQ